MGGNFPGPPLPPSGHPRNALALLGSFLSNFQFTLSLMLPYMYRAGELLQREQNLQGPQERLRAQHLCNMVGRALDDLARSAALTAHLFRDLEIGHRPGEFRLHNNGMREEFSGIQQHMPRLHPAVSEQPSS